MSADREIAKISIATPADAPALGAMHVASWREIYAGLLPDKMLSSLSVESRANAWAKIIQEPATERSTVIYLAEHQGTIIGFGSWGAQRTHSLKDKGYDGEVSAIYVLREFQKRRIGTRLLRAMTSGLQRRRVMGVTRQLESQTLLRTLWRQGHCRKRRCPWGHHSHRIGLRLERT